MSASNWTAKGGALSDKSAREEYGLSRVSFDRRSTSPKSAKQLQFRRKDCLWGKR
ncbi:MAG: hypothetical protein KDB27_00960 [Planctomycetales bacterium]|nr:hypothetical protein [Planctomycetales bacterium]